MEVETKQPKNYYWVTEEREGVRHNTLKYNRRPPPPPDSQTSQQTEDRPSSGEICQNNCCTFLLIFIIFVLTVLLILSLLRSYHTQYSPLKNINNRSSAYSSRNTVLPTEKSFTFFPF